MGAWIDRRMDKQTRGRQLMDKRRRWTDGGRVEQTKCIAKNQSSIGVQERHVALQDPAISRRVPSKNNVE